jgi:two-component system, chemotaxis family, chemotaxis protein CheY
MQGVDFPSLRFLVVEDSLHMRRILRTMLMGLGVRDVEEAEDGAEGLDRLRGINPDVVLLDWVMPILDGIEFTRLARTGGGANPYVPIIMVTAHAERHNVIKARDAGVNEFLTKPLSAKALHDRIVSVVTRPRAFVKTKTFFGPDRRRFIMPNFAGENRRITESDASFVPGSRKGAA